MTNGIHAEPGRSTSLDSENHSPSGDDESETALPSQPSRCARKAPASLAERLLTVPAFVRTNNAAHLYVCYSRKNRGRVHMEEKRRFQLFVRLECDPNVRRLNMAVTEASSVDAELPAAVSLDRNHRLTVHRFAGGKDGEEARVAWESWCKRHGFVHLEWRSADLLDNPVLLESRARLLRFVTRAGSPPDEVLKEIMLCELRRVRRATFTDMLRLGEGRPIDEVQATVADLLLTAEVESDIGSKPLSMATLMEVHHA